MSDSAATGAEEPSRDGSMVWKTAIAEVQDHDVVIRGYQQSELVGAVSYTDAVFLVLTGGLPDDPQRQMLDAILVSLIEHGISPSTMLTRMLVSCGTPLQAAVAGGVLSIADWHGGSGEQVAEHLSDILGSSETFDEEVALENAIVLVDRYVADGTRMEGFGHPQHSDGDPRATRLVDLAVGLGVAGRHVDALGTLEKAIHLRMRRQLRPNITAAIAAILMDLGIPGKAIRGIVIGARAPGLAAHVVEELEQGGRWRHASSDQVEYTGPRGRSLNG